MKIYILQYISYGDRNKTVQVFDKFFGDSDLFYYTGKNHGRRRCDAHVNHIKVWGNI